MRVVAHIAQRLGALRVLLSSFALVLIVATPFSDPGLSPHGWEIVQSVVLPVAAPMVFIVLMLDLMMVQIFKSQFTAGSVQYLRFGFIAKWNLIIGFLLILLWLPVFLRATSV